MAAVGAAACSESEGTRALTPRGPSAAGDVQSVIEHHSLMVERMVV